jgi:deoxyadenosine/deoxycytidine kinase
MGPEITRSQSYERWWNDAAEWAATLDALVWLDAPDELLYERVIAREQRHEAREQPRGEVLERFACYRTWYERVVAEMAVLGGLRVLRFRTDRMSTEQMAESVLATLNL